MRENRNAYSVVVKKSMKETDHLDDPRHKLDGIKMNLKDTGWKGHLD
jgi:hypothetical protein